MRSISARSVGITFLCVVIFGDLSIQVAWRATAVENTSQIGAVLAPNCGASVYAPVKVQVVGTLVARASVECTNSRLMRLNVKLQRRVDGVWRWRADAIGKAEQLTDRLTVKVAAPCRVGAHRTFSVHSIRQNSTDPWQVRGRFASPPLLIRRCPNGVADERSPTAFDFPVGCGATDYWPFKWQGRLIAKSESGCDSPWYMRLTAKLQGRVGGAWGTIAAAIANAPELTDSLVAKVSIPCREGRYRTYGRHGFRQDPSDPWHFTPFSSALVGIVGCPS
jgi:hypothetical protein